MDAKLMTQLDAELMAEIGREIERMEDLIHDLRAENKRLREAGNNLRCFVSLFAGGDESMHLAIAEWDKEALK